MDKALDVQCNLVEQEEEEEEIKRQEKLEIKRRELICRVEAFLKEEQENSLKNGKNDDVGHGGKKGKESGLPNDSSDRYERYQLFIARSKLESKTERDSSNDKKDDSKGAASSSD